MPVLMFSGRKRMPLTSRPSLLFQVIFSGMRTALASVVGSVWVKYLGAPPPRSATTRSADSTGLARRKKIRFPSEDHSGADSTPGLSNFASCFGELPSTGTTQISDSSLSVRFDVTAIDMPFGAKTGFKSSNAPLVSCFGFPPVAGISQTLSQPLSCRITARVLLSGDQLALPTDHPPPRSVGEV